MNLSMLSIVLMLIEVKSNIATILQVSNMRVYVPTVIVTVSDGARIQGQVSLNSETVLLMTNLLLCDYHVIQKNKETHLQSLIYFICTSWPLIVSSHFMFTKKNIRMSSYLNAMFFFLCTISLKLDSIFLLKVYI